MLRGSFDIHFRSFIAPLDVLPSSHTRLSHAHIHSRRFIPSFFLHFSIYDCAWHAGVGQVHWTSENRGSMQEHECRLWNLLDFWSAPTDAGVLNLLFTFFMKRGVSELLSLKTAVSESSRRCFWVKCTLLCLITNFLLKSSHYPPRSRREWIIPGKVTYDFAHAHAKP